MTAPFVAVVAHRRDMHTPLGTLTASLVYDAYLELLAAAGASAALVSPALPAPEPVLRAADGLLFIGGGDVAPTRFGGDDEAAHDVDADRDDLESALVLRAREQRTPVLGMCRGAQLLNVALGGTLRTVDGHVQEDPLDLPHHDVEVVTGSRVAAITGVERAGVNSFHRWAVDDPAPGLVVSATADDGVVEAIESDDDGWFALGIQWHAELLDAEHVPTLFENFVDATGRARR